MYTFFTSPKDTRDDIRPQTENLSSLMAKLTEFGITVFHFTSPKVTEDKIRPQIA